MKGKLILTRVLWVWHIMNLRGGMCLQCLPGSYAYAHTHTIIYAYTYTHTHTHTHTLINIHTQVLERECLKASKFYKSTAWHIVPASIMYYNNDCVTNNVLHQGIFFYHER